MSMLAVVLEMVSGEVVIGIAFAWLLSWLFRRITDRRDRRSIQRATDVTLAALYPPLPSSIVAGQYSPSPSSVSAVFGPMWPTPVWGAPVSRGSSDPTLYAGRGGTDPHSIVYGLRNWNIDNLSRLVGKTYKNSVWTPGENRAVCLKIAGTGISPASVAKLAEPDHDMEQCSGTGGGHGFYAYYDGSRDFHTAGDVTGVIKGWGEAVVGDKGFRVMNAEIVAIMFDDNTAPQVRARVQQLYPDVPVFTSIDVMLAEFPLSADDLEYVPEADDDFWTKDA